MEHRADHLHPRNAAAVGPGPGATAAAESADLLIVGAGSVGLFGAYCVGVRDMSTVVIDSLDQPGEQVTVMYTEKAIYDVAGFPAVKGSELIGQLLAQAVPFDPAYVLGDQAVSLQKTGDGFVVATASGVTCTAGLS
jgi:thioredoxin reductase (NADPH)